MLSTSLRRSLPLPSARTRLSPTLRVLPSSRLALSPNCRPFASTRFTRAVDAPPPTADPAAPANVQTGRRVAIGVAALLGAYATYRLTFGAGGGVRTVSDAPQVFDVPVYLETGSKGVKELRRLSEEETVELLRKNEVSRIVTDSHGVISRFDSNSVASNSPSEDDYVNAAVKAIKTEALKGDLYFFGIFDGHAGYHTSKYLSQELVPAVVRELSLVYASHSTYASQLPTVLPSQISIAPSGLGSIAPFSWFNRPSSTPTLAQITAAERLNDLIQKHGSIDLAFGKASAKDLKGARITNVDESPEVVSKAIEKAFLDLDELIVNKPLQQLAVFKIAGEKPEWNGKPTHQQRVKDLHDVALANSGSCALLALVDSAKNRLHVACTGDSRAVLGVWEVDAEGKGHWQTVALSDDQTGDNLKEIKRIQAEHPPDEEDQLVTKSRLLGGLAVTRAFGDAWYKWPRDTSKTLNASFNAAVVRPQPADNIYRTPPYLIARPEILAVDLPKVSPATSSQAGIKPGQSFLILATDGLWDCLTSEEAVALVGNHLTGTRSSLTPEQALASVSPAKDVVKTATTAGTGTAHQPKARAGRGFAFEDDNLATHLVRNALGGAERERVSSLLSVPYPPSRWYRDDITVTVVLLNSANDSTRA